MTIDFVYTVCIYSDFHLKNKESYFWICCHLSGRVDNTLATTLHYLTLPHTTSHCLTLPHTTWSYSSPLGPSVCPTLPPLYAALSGDGKYWKIFEAFWPKSKFYLKKAKKCRKKTVKNWYILHRQCHSVWGMSSHSSEQWASLVRGRACMCTHWDCCHVMLSITSDRAIPSPTTPATIIDHQASARLEKLLQVNIDITISLWLSMFSSIRTFQSFCFDTVMCLSVL